MKKRMAFLALLWDNFVMGMSVQGYQEVAFLRVSDGELF